MNGHLRSARSTLLPLLLVALAATAACTGGGGSADPPSPSSRADTSVQDILIGVSSPFREDRNLLERVEALETEVVGRRFGAVRLYRRWDETFPSDSEIALSERGTTLVLSVSTQRTDLSWIPWSDIAAAPPGSELAADLDNWASMIASVPGPVIAILDHEPDFYRNGGDGEPADYLAAYDRFATAVRQADPTVRLAWIGVAFFFNENAPTDATEFFPGADEVDFVGADGFNWATCRDDPGTWRSFDDVFEDFIVWADTEVPDTPIVLAEVGTVEDLDDPDRKAQWLRAAATSMATEQWERLHAVIFWDNVHENDPACDFRLGSSARSERALASIVARDIFHESD